MNFSGATYKHSKDYQRLSGQLMKIFNLMIDGVPRTPDEVANELGLNNIPSVSAQLRNLRKRNLNIQRQDRDGIRGVSEYWFDGSFALSEPSVSDDSKLEGTSIVTNTKSLGKPQSEQKKDCSLTDISDNSAVSLTASARPCPKCKDYPLMKSLFDGIMVCSNSRCKEQVKVA